MSNRGLVYIGKITELTPIEGADFIVSATVICGEGGKWRGIVRKADFNVNDECVVFLPDSQLNEVDHADMPYMKDSAWRVKMRRFKGAPSEVVITKNKVPANDFFVGEDITEEWKVTKYNKPIPAHLNGKIKGDFPQFIPKTDEPNYQRSPELVEQLIGKSYYITEKADGSSTTAYKYKGEFGVCSRNLELVKDPENGYWKVAIEHGLEEKLPEGIALQWETCGPGIQSNPMGLDKIQGFAFSAYNIAEHRYLEWGEFINLVIDLEFPTCPLDLTGNGDGFTAAGLETLGEGTYKNGKPREGVVVRSIENHENGRPISFKVINLDYGK